MKRFIYKLLILSLVSCGNVIQDSVDEIANQTSGMLNFSGSFQEDDITGIWESNVSYDYAEIHKLYEDAIWLELETYQKISEEELEEVKKDTEDCSLTSLNESSINFIETRHYFEFLNDTYRYIASSKIVFLDGSSTQCQFQIGAGEFSILSNYIYLRDLEKPLFVDIISGDSLYMGFAE